MMTPRLLMVAMALTGLTLSHANGDTITVCQSGCDFTSIIAAIDVAEEGDVIQLSAETYLEGADLDCDGIVSGTDLSALLANWHSS